MITRPDDHAKVALVGVLCQWLSGADAGAIGSRREPARTKIEWREVGEEGRTDEAIVVVVELHGGNLHVQLEGDVVAVPNLANDEHLRSIERLSCRRLIGLATASTRNEPRLCRQAVAH
jgi:hypothetical protein